MLREILGLLQPRPEPRDEDVRYKPMPPKVIVGGDQAPELCMLPTDLTVAELAEMPGDERQVVQLKGDGIRALYVHGRIVTREGAPLDCALHAKPGLRRLEDAFGHEMMFDGEYIEEGGFNATLSAMQKREGQGVFWIFDAVPLGAWTVGGWDIPLVDRLQALRERIPEADTPFVGMLDWWLLTPEETAAKAAEFWALGYEGLVRKIAASSYERRRSAAWRRLKRVITDDVPIVDGIVADGVLKSILVRMPGATHAARISKGWSAAEAEAILMGLEAGTAMTVEASFQLTTGATRSVRGAVFHRLRADKGAIA